jgi:putative salt-induced outer membrane protein YdiY
MNDGSGPARLAAGALLATLAVVLWPAGALGDVLIMKNGDRLTGTVDRLEGGTLTFKTRYAGTLSVGWGDVASLSTVQPVTIVTEDEKVLTGTLAPEEGNGGTMFTEQAAEPFPIDLSTVNYINPPPDLLGLGIRWHGDVNAGLIVERGNTDKDQYHLDFSLKGRSKHYRHRLFGQYSFVVNEGENTASNWDLAGTSDRFLNKKLYVSGSLSFQNNKFQDIRLRTTPAVSVGYQVWESELRNLSVDFGPAYVDERHYEGEDIDYWAGRWGLDLDYWVYRRVTQFFHTQTGRVSVNPDHRVIWNTRQGLRFPLTDHLRTTLELDYNLDTEPEVGVEKTDTKYLVTIGYAW